MLGMCYDSTIYSNTSVQTVVPGFEYQDHDFMPAVALHELVTAEQENELRWLLSARA